MQDEATQLKKELRESKRRREAEKEEKEAQERGTNNECMHSALNLLSLRAESYPFFLEWYMHLIRILYPALSMHNLRTLIALMHMYIVIGISMLIWPQE